MPPVLEDFFVDRSGERIVLGTVAAGVRPLQC